MLHANAPTAEDSAIMMIRESRLDVASAAPEDVESDGEEGTIAEEIIVSSELNMLVESTLVVPGWLEIAVAVKGRLLVVEKLSVVN